MDYLFIFLSGFATCVVAIGTLWFLRECERAKAFKALREENEFLRARDRRARRVMAYVRDGLREISNGSGGRAMLPAPAKQVRQRPEDLAYSRGRLYAAAPVFLRRGQ